WPELELLRPVRVLGYPQARGLEQREPFRIRLGPGPAHGPAVQLVRPRDLWNHPCTDLHPCTAGDSGQGVVQGLLREDGRAAVLRRRVPVSDDDVAAHQDARTVAVQPEVHRLDRGILL